MKNSRKHILALASWYPSRVFLDNGDFIQRHLRAISTLNDVTLVHAIKDEKLKSDFEVVDSINQNVREIIVYFKPSFFRPFNLINQFRAFLKGTSFVKKVDLIHLNVVYPAGLIAAYLKYRFRKPIVYTEHWTIFSPERLTELSLYQKILIKNILSKVDYLCAVSKDLDDKISSVFSIKPSKIIPNVINLDNFSINEESEKDQKIFLHLSHLGDEHKNITGMLNVAKRLVEEGFDFQFQIGGNGDLSMIDEFIKENNLSNVIQSFGRLEYDEVNQKMKNATCFVLFSNYENQPCVQIEAFSSGIPVIASNVGGISEFFPEGFGVLIEKQNENQLYEAMKNFIENKIELKSRAELHQFAEDHFSTQKIAQQFDNVYNSVLE
ncbi:glycosyltransferase family 4 protein [Empedobacter brevis]|uniref:Glycosyltransferase family 4 protein n=1 Tax=Empedobacter brevis TaxID=247 RepID=A0AAJ1QE35_9FLAO|nr:glycosyltransferase family 4 protein [Empedobacter brevis]MDM1072388.1 glycosyltransferase family 4 protein [Empedobacter brevis]